MNEASHRLYKALIAVGIPIVGVSVGAGNARIDFESSATPQQRAQAESIASGWDFRSRRPRSHGAVQAEVAGLADAPFRQLMAHLAADYIRSNPDWAIDLGVNIPGDEPEA